MSFETASGGPILVSILGLGFATLTIVRVTASSASRGSTGVTPFSRGEVRVPSGLAT